MNIGAWFSFTKERKFSFFFGHSCFLTQLFLSLGFASGQDFIEKYVAAREPNFLLGLVEKSLSDFATEEGEKNFGEKAHKDVSCRIKVRLIAQKSIHSS